MLSTATVMRKTGATTTDPDGFEVDVWVTVGTLPFRLDSGSSDGASRGVTVGGLSFEEATGVANVPHDSDTRLGDALMDNDLLDVSGETTGVWRIVAALAYDQKTARRLPIAEERRPAEWA